MLVSISPKTASPVLKSNLIIVGSNFGEDRSKLTVTLNNLSGTKIYDLGVVSSNDTHI